MLVNPARCGRLYSVRLDEIARTVESGVKAHQQRVLARIRIKIPPRAVDDKAAAGVIAGLIDACKGVPRKEMKEFEFEYVEEEEEEEAPDEAQEQVEPAAQEQ